MNKGDWAHGHGDAAAHDADAADDDDRVTLVGSPAGLLVRLVLSESY